jgi:putative sigma-54 modulation protein
LVKKNDQEEMMQVELRIRNTDLADVLRGYTDRRLRFAVSRFGDRVGRVVVTVSGLNGQGLPAAVNCYIGAELKPFGQLAVQESDLNLYTAIDRAAGRLGRLFALRLGRGADDVQALVSSTDRAGETKEEKSASIVRPRRLPRKRIRKRGLSEARRSADMQGDFRLLSVTKHRERGENDATRLKSSEY